MEEREERITLLDEEGRSRDFTLVDVIEVDERRYAVLQPIEPAEGEDDAAAVVFRIEDDTLVAIDDESEFDRVVEVLEATESYDDVTLVNGEGGDPEGGA